MPLPELAAAAIALIGLIGVFIFVTKQGFVGILLRLVLLIVIGGAAFGTYFVLNRGTPAEFTLRSESIGSGLLDWSLTLR